MKQKTNPEWRAWRSGFATGIIVGSLIVAMTWLASVRPAHAQIQPAPNIAPNGARFTFSPRFGYLGPPVGFVYGSLPPSRAMPMVQVPRPLPPDSAPPPLDTAPPGAPPMRFSGPPATGCQENRAGLTGTTSAGPSAAERPMPQRLPTGTGDGTVNKRNKKPDFSAGFFRAASNL
jgi:hypothetical protein